MVDWVQQRHMFSTFDWKLIDCIMVYHLRYAVKWLAELTENEVATSTTTTIITGDNLHVHEASRTPSTTRLLVTHGKQSLIPTFYTMTVLCLVHTTDKTCPCEWCELDIKLLLVQSDSIKCNLHRDTQAFLHCHYVCIRVAPYLISNPAGAKFGFSSRGLGQGEISKTLTLYDYTPFQ